MDNSFPVNPKPPVTEQQQAVSQLQSYEQQLAKFRVIPQHEFEHKLMILETTQIPEKAEIMNILTKELQIANIKDDKLLRIYQIQLHNVIEWHDMGLWNDVGRWAFTRMVGELQLSKSKGAMERMLQSGAIPIVSGLLTGFKNIFGKQPQFQHEWEQQSQNQGMLQKQSQY